MKSSVIVGMFLIMVASVLAQTNTQESYQSIYAKATFQLEDDLRKRNEAALDQYDKALVELLAVYKQKGDIDSYSLVDDERKRFVVSKTITTNQPPIQYAQAVGVYRKQVQDIQASYETKKLNLMKRYIAAVNVQIKDLMARDKMAEAKAAADSKKAAEFELAEMEAKQGVDQKMPVKSGVPAAGDQPVTVPTASGKVSLANRKAIPEEAQSYGGHHYLHITDMITWENAKTACEELGGHLAIITNKKEDDFIKKLVGQPARPAWIGLTDKDKEGEWRWVDGSRLTYVGLFGHDDRVGNENYAACCWGDNLRWEDLGSNRVFGYVCEWDY